MSAQFLRTQKTHADILAKLEKQIGYAFSLIDALEKRVTVIETKPKPGRPPKDGRKETTGGN